MTVAAPAGQTLILSRAGDPHASEVAAALARANCGCEVADSDALAWDGALSWDGTTGETRLRCASGATVALADVDTLWWRRANRQRALGDVSARVEDVDAQIVNRACAASWLGALLVRPPRRVVDDPWAVFRAENKIVQLSVASRLGLRVPPTLVSNDPGAIRGFARRHRWTIAKTLRHAPGAALATVPVDEAMLDDGEALSACPTIYQALVPGKVHLRLLMFGQEVLGARLRSDQLDWRGGEPPDMAGYTPDSALVGAMRALLDALGLSMGVFDFKLDGAAPVFLEVNPQGQFLSVARFADADWAARFARFLTA